jgi:PP-loop superfamily ATP-utilizing enzyme
MSVMTRIVKYFQNGREISEVDAKRVTRAGFLRRGFMDLEEFQDIWSASKLETEAGEVARDQIFEWSECTVEIDIGW